MLARTTRNVSPTEAGE
ncbi:hypothetical protein M1M11_04305 [Pseudomonas azerbaijanoccidens]|nr:hypothetical protein [Pseudomonas azerbaijanoccidentalis]